MNRNKQNFSSFLKSGLFVFLSVFLIYSLINNWLDYRKKIRFYENYNQALDKAQTQNKTLKSEIIKSQDYSAAEKLIRNRLNLLKPDEIAVIVPRATPTVTPTPTPHYSPAAQWRRLFFDDNM